MSKEKEPIRSRRQLRQQSAQESAAAGYPAVPLSPAPGGPAVAADPVAGTDVAAAPETATAADGAAAPNDAAATAVPPATIPAPRGERESQIRARDRAALRAYKELVDQPGTSPLPTRRALRQAQLEAERAPVTSINPVVSAAAPASAPKTLPPAPKESAPLTNPAPAPGVALQGPVSEAAAAQPESAPRTRVGRRAAAAPADRVGTSRSAAALAAKTALGAKTAPGATSAPAAVSAASDESHPAAGSATPPEQSAAATQASGMTGPETTHAVAANYPPMPGLVPGGSYYPVSAGPPSGVIAPSTEELRTLTAQRAESERAAILAERAQARDRLAQESAKNKRPAADPTATNNLAMVTPLEFVEVPGVERPVMRPPTTTHVPIVARPAPARKAPRTTATTQGTVPPRRPATAAPSAVPAPEAAAETSAGPLAAPQAVGSQASGERFDAAVAAGTAHRPAPGNNPFTGGRSKTLKQAVELAHSEHPPAPAAAEQGEVQRSQMPPVPADYAHGLEPLDAMTAGLARTRRNMLIHWGSIAAGGAAFVVGAIMLITSLVR